MKKESVFHADDSATARDGFASIIESFGSRDGHSLIGQASSVDEVRQEMENGIKPTVAIIDNKMPNEGDGEKAAQIIRQMSPNTIIISLSSDENVGWGDFNLLKNIPAPKLIAFITNLKPRHS